MTAAASASLRYLALGDSYTIGEAVAESARWPAVLADQLRLAGIAIDAPHFVAITGWTTDELSHGMDIAGLTPVYDLVTLQIGVNNQYRGRTAEEYRQQFFDLLVRASSLAGDRPWRVVVVSIPDWGVTRFAAKQGRDREVIARELDNYNMIASAESRRIGTHFIDITGISRQHPEAVTDDGLHPSSVQYRLWVEQIKPSARQALLRVD